MILNNLIRSPKIVKKLKLSTFQHANQSNQSPDSTTSSNVESTFAIPQPPEVPLKKPESSVNSKLCSKLIENAARINPCGIQMLPSNILHHLFGNQGPAYSDKDVKNSLVALKKYSLNVENVSTVPEVDLKIPPLEGCNVEEHFMAIGRQQSEPYRLLLESLTAPLVERPSVWELQAGWTKYVPGQPPQKVNFPEEDAIVFDIEVCQSAGQMPTLAIAASSKAWYGWVSSSLTDGTISSSMGEKYSTQHLIPLESGPNQKNTCKVKRPRVAVGHNVMYDRARIKEQYFLEPTGMRFVDTMSLHVCVSGVTSFQKSILSRAKKANSENQEISVENEESSSDAEDLASLQENTSLNGLADVLRLYCGKELDKAGRDVFIDGTLSDVRRHFQSSMSYCASDVAATQEVLKSLFPLFLKRFPHPVTLAGMLEISMAYLPVNRNWIQYLENSEQTYQDLGVEARFQLARRADEACSLLHDEKYRKDLWMWDQDWSLQNLRLTKRKSKAKEPEVNLETIVNDDIVEDTIAEPHVILDELKRKDKEFEEEIVVNPEVQSIIDTGFQLPVKSPHLPGYPTWYRKLCVPPKKDDWAPGPQLITTKMQVSPKLLHLTWEKYPLHYIRGQGWGSLRPIDMKELPPIDDNNDLPIRELVEFWESIPEEERKCGGDVEVCPGVMFSRLPHKNGAGLRVGDPLGRDFIVKFSEKVLSGDSVAERMMDIAKKLSYWRNNRDRIMKQMVVWLTAKDLPPNLEDFQAGAILPQLIICGTLTRRAVERTWMTASNISKERIGSELRAMIQAPRGYSIVGADVDSQELWIASLIGDAYASKIHGGTPFGWMTISGRKSEGTDMHSVTAKAVGISRDHAKVINYARIYGAGVPFAEQLLKQFNPSMSVSDAKSKAQKMFRMTKGRRVYVPNSKYVGMIPFGPYSAYDAAVAAGQFGAKRSDIFRLVWNGGTESAVFNRLEEIAHSRTPETPFLGGRLSRALESQQDKNLPTRINWVVQSGAVDFLHLLLVAFKWLEPDARFCLSFHDEVRYLVPDDKAHRAALALHVAHLLTRAFCVSRLGLTDLPLSVAFFTSVEVDKTLRKEAHDNCQTPSNPHGLLKGYAIQPGENLDIYKSIEKAGGPAALLSNQKRKDVSCNKT